MYCRCGATAVCCDPSPGQAGLSERVVACNGSGSKVKVLAKDVRSMATSDIGGAADVAVFEVSGSHSPI